MNRPAGVRRAERRPKCLSSSTSEAEPDALPPWGVKRACSRRRSRASAVAEPLRWCARKWARHRVEDVADLDFEVRPPGF